ncbi:hypothetical protein BSKO_13483 [Bryopsis sp. KO-2023]|nr:hypothetical protein BSKO_13483 [Bryopsis sp. KO-2023]
MFGRTRDLVRHVDAFYRERYGLGLWSLEPIQAQPQPQPQRDLEQWEVALEERERELKKREEELNKREKGVQEREQMASQVIMMVVVVEEEQGSTEGATQPSNEESTSVIKTKDVTVEVLKPEKIPVDHGVAVELKKRVKPGKPVKPTQGVRQPQVPPKKKEIKKEEMTDEIPKGTSWGDYMEGLSKGVAVVQRPPSIVPSRRRKKKNVRCREFEKGFCKFGPDCMFLHEEPVKAL